MNIQWKLIPLCRETLTAGSSRVIILPSINLNMTRKWIGPETVIVFLKGTEYVAYKTRLLQAAKYKQRSDSIEQTSLWNKLKKWCVQVQYEMVYVVDSNRWKLGEALGRCRICGSGKVQLRWDVTRVQPQLTYPVAVLQPTAMATTPNWACGQRCEGGQRTRTWITLTLSPPLCSQFVAA